MTMLKQTVLLQNARQLYELKLQAQVHASRTSQILSFLFISSTALVRILVGTLVAIFSV
jgi:hypothetical protein